MIDRAARDRMLPSADAFLAFMVLMALALGVIAGLIAGYQYGYHAAEQHAAHSVHNAQGVDWYD